MRIGIIGNSADKFTPETAEKAKILIRDILIHYADNPILVSGHCHLGGVDIWAEEIAKEIGFALDIKTPKTLSWNGPYGFKARNLDIARASDCVHVIVVKDYPPEYKGMRFKMCYHCKSTHVKSGACWTAIKAKELGKPTVWHII